VLERFLEGDTHRGPGDAAVDSGKQEAIRLMRS
jgi:hypothetical protein